MKSLICFSKGMNTKVTSEVKTTNIDVQRKSDLAKIHIAKKQLGQSDEDYRALMLHVTGHDSAKDLSPADRKNLIAHYKKIGFKSEKPKDKNKSKSNLNPQQQMIIDLWASLQNKGIVRSTDISGLNKWIYRQTGLHRLEWLNDHQLSTCIESLKKWLARSIT